MVKEIKTKKFEGLAVLVPDDAGKFSIKKTRKGYADQLHYYVPYTLDVVSNQRLVILQGEGYEVLGKATELTEEQCAEIVDYKTTGYFKSYAYKNADFIFNTAKESFTSLMQSLECYSVNPLNPPIERLQYGGEYTMRQSEIDEYEEAQANTGTWIILRKL